MVLIIIKSRIRIFIVIKNSKNAIKNIKILINYYIGYYHLVFNQTDWCVTLINTMLP